MGLVGGDEASTQPLATSVILETNLGIKMAPPNGIALLNPMLVGVATAFCTVLINALVVATIVWAVRRDLKLGRLGHGTRYWPNLFFVASAIMLALVGHLAEIGLWALVFRLCGEFSGFEVAFYHSAVNFTTLGYGDILMSARWRLLGPLEAADGMLMFGVSTALIFTVIQRLIEARLGPFES